MHMKKENDACFFLIFWGAGNRLCHSVVIFVPFQERGLSLYEDQEIKDESVESNTATLRDAISLAVPDETSSGKNVLYHSVNKTA